MIKTLLALIGVLVSGVAFGAPDAPKNLTYNSASFTADADLQAIIYDDNYEGWKISAYLGRFGSSWRYHDGPQREASGTSRFSECVDKANENKTYCAFAAEGQRRRNIVEIDNSAGTARLFISDSGAFEGDRIDVSGGHIIYNPNDQNLYLVDHYCVRKIDSATDTVSTYVGLCGKSGTTDGTGTDARFEDFRGATFQDDGSLYLIFDNTTDGFRKVSPSGVVTTIPLKRPEERTTVLWNFIQNGFGNLHASNDPNILYLNDQYNVSDGYNLAVIDLTTNEISTVAGASWHDNPYRRAGRETDGPGLTHVGFVGSMNGKYSSFYDTFIVDASDNIRNRVYQPDDGWVYTLGEKIRPGIIPGPYDSRTAMGTNLDYETNHFRRLSGTSYTNVIGVDSRGGIYQSYSSPNHIIWRFYNSLLGGTE